MAVAGGALSASPQRAQAGPLQAENSDQQTGQIGTEESRGRGEPQRAQEAGSRAQLKLSIGLRSTRTTARHRVVCDGGTSVMRMAVSLGRRTSLRGKADDAARCAKYSASRKFPARGRTPSADLRCNEGRRMTEIENGRKRGRAANIATKPVIPCRFISCQCPRGLFRFMIAPGRRLADSSPTRRSG